MEELDTDAVRDGLRAQLADLDGRIADLARAPERGAGVSFGKRVGDGTTEAIGRLTEIGVGESLESTRDQVAAALDRLDEGTYGCCARCGTAIAPARLQARPESVLCIACARAAPRR